MGVEQFDQVLRSWVSAFCEQSADQIPLNVKHAEVFLACQREARDRRRGLWVRS